jgi:hypothetical protein
MTDVTRGVKVRGKRRTKAEMLAARMGEDQRHTLSVSELPSSSHLPRPVPDVTLGEFAGPDPHVIAEHQARVAAGTPTPAARTFTVTLPDRYAAYLLDYAARQSIRRGGIKITPERALEIMVRETWRVDQDRMLDTAGGTVPAALGPKVGARS